MTEEMRCTYLTCLDRARIALEQIGQHTCAGVMRELQEEINKISVLVDVDANDPVMLLMDLFDYWDSFGKVNNLEAKRPHPPR